MAEQQAGYGEVARTPRYPFLFWGSALGVVLGAVVGAIAGGIIATGWLEAGVLAYLLWLVGALVGVVIAAPVGLLLGWCIGAFIEMERFRD
jgi:hypothetical protein